MDGFHLADVELARLGRAVPQGRAGHVRPRWLRRPAARIVAGETVWAPAFERVLEQPIAQAVPGGRRDPDRDQRGQLPAAPDPVAATCAISSTRCGSAAGRARRASTSCIARHVRFGKTPDEARAWVLRSDEVNATFVAASAEAADLVVDLA